MEDNRGFILSCESTVDMPYSYVEGRDIPVLFYTYTVDGEVYPDDMGRDPEALPRFYDMLRAGKVPSTSQIGEAEYERFFDGLLQRGDVLHIAFGTGMTRSYDNAVLAAEALRGRYPQRTITVIDSLCSSSGYGMLVDYAADLRDAGAPMAQVAQWVMEHRRRVHHQFYSTDLTYYRRSGRMSGAAAAIESILDICPIMRLDADGRIKAYDKVHGERKAIARTVDVMEAHAQGGTDYAGKCFICHSDCPDQAQTLREAVRKRFPHVDGDVRVFDIGTIIAAHCGPHTLAVFFLGDERAPYPLPKDGRDYRY